MIQREMRKTETQFQTPTKQRNNAKEPSNDHKNKLKEEILQVITENFMEILLDMVNQNIQEASRSFKTPKIKKTRRHRNK
jgi:predicted house-cleaning noncanonical NTP pyrophosphatase (MazG superfamily)